MSREIAIRVPSEIGGWVRQQSGSATDTILALAKDLWKRRQSIRVHDPGPGADRLKVRLEPRVLRFVRAATHSRDATAAVRKLLLWGAESRALPPSPSRSAIPAPAKAEPRAMAAPGPVRALPGVADPEAARMVAAQYKENPELGERARALALQARVRPPMAVFENPAPDSPAYYVPAPVSRIVEAIPVPVLAIGLPVAMLAGGYFLLKWLGGLASAGKIVAGVATAAKVAPSIAAWTPQAAAGLGALFL